MRTFNRRSFAIAIALALFIGPSFSQSPPGGTPTDWKAVVQSRLPLYGHRNWIVVADSAFPVYSEPGIETIVADEDLPTVLEYVANAISSSRHVRATVFLDKELQFIDEQDYPGVSELRRKIAGTFMKDQISSIPHVEVMNRIDEAGKTFRILFIKTTGTIPYTSVYMRLDCGYMSNEVETKISTAMASSEKQKSK